MENHVVCVPFPAQGHIRPMLKLAQLLHFKFDLSITFINTYHIHQTMFKHQHHSSGNKTRPFFRFESLPEDDDPKDIISVINSIIANNLELPLKELLATQLHSSNNSNSNCSQPRVSCMISDVGMSSFTLRVAQELGIPAVLLETASACSLLAYSHCRQLLDKGIIPLQDNSWVTNGYLEKTIDWIPSLKGISLKDMPTFIRTTEANDINHMVLDIVMSNAHRALKSEAILINTFDALEQDVLEDLSTISPNIYPIGPLNLMVDYHISKKDTINIEENSIDYEHIKWLGTQEPKSVLYVSFGSLVGVDQETFIELAWGLANSLARFLWIVRSDQVVEERFMLEFNRFREEIKGRGVLIDWCDQDQVLAHPSIGGFFTHCGWNSTIESISYGVPMICWPLVADQSTNSWYCCNRLGIGMKMSKEVKRDYVERVVKELMETDNGKEMATKVAKWRNIAIEVTMSSHGSSYHNLNNVVNNLLKVRQ